MRTLFVATAVAAGVQLAPTDGAPRISQVEFKQLRAAKKVIVVDTRNEDAYTRGHIPGAILLPLEGLPTWPAEYNKTVDTLKAAKKPIVTYCA
jgi:rhodanese-related sulfurtransferase